jgi:hypothetical protein
VIGGEALKVTPPLVAAAGKPTTGPRPTQPTKGGSL